jgi:hypothetical protein
MRPIVEKILTRLKFDEDDDIVAVLKNELYFKALQIALGFTQSEALNTIRAKLYAFLDSI